MKKVKLLYQHLGLNSYTEKTPVAEWQGQVDLNEKKEVCLSYDDDRLIKINKWEVREIELPDWLSVDEYLKKQVKFDFLWGDGASKDWPEIWQRKLMSMQYDSRKVCLKLLNVKKFRSSFRESLREQLEKWLNAEENNFNSPFSSKQWECLFRYE